MRRVVRIDDIDVGEYGGLWIREDNESTNFITEEFATISGARVTFVQSKDITAKNITLDSKENGWISRSKKEDLLNFANSQLGSFDIETKDGDLIRVRFRHIPAIQFENLYEGSLLYRAVINLSEAL